MRSRSPSVTKHQKRHKAKVWTCRSQGLFAIKLSKRKLQSLSKQSPDLELYTDASGIGYGGFLRISGSAKNGGRNSNTLRSLPLCGGKCIPLLWKFSCGVTIGETRKFFYTVTISPLYLHGNQVPAAIRKFCASSETHC